MPTQMLSRSRVAVAVATAAVTAIGIAPALASGQSKATPDAPPPTTQQTHQTQQTRSGTTALTDGWAIRSSAEAGTDGAAISQPGYRTDGWLPISKPETLMAGLIENGKYPDVFYSDNLAKVPTAQFDADWWYREHLVVRPGKNEHSFLVLNGVSGKADLWINGTRIGTNLQGSYGRFEYDVTKLLRDGDNAIAVKVSRNDADITKFDTPMRYLSQNFVDWNPMSPDQGTGLQFAPELRRDGTVSMRDTHVVQRNAKDLSSSDLTVKSVLRNNTATKQRARFTATVSHGRTRLTCTATYGLQAHQTKQVECRMHVSKPAVWWPYQLGKQPMYHLDAAGRINRKTIAKDSTDFGIRTVTSSLTKPVAGTTHGKDGYRRYTVNGVPLVIRGGGWSPDMFQRYDRGNIAKQIAAVKNLGLNTLRFEGNFPPDDMFRQLDRAGVLAMPGWQCCAAWEYDSKTWSAAQRASAPPATCTDPCHRSVSPAGTSPLSSTKPVQNGSGPGRVPGPPPAPVACHPAVLTGRRCADDGLERDDRVPDPGLAGRRGRRCRAAARWTEAARDARRTAADTEPADHPEQTGDPAVG